MRPTRGGAAPAAPPPVASLPIPARKPLRRPGERWASVAFVAPLLAIFASFYLWPAMQTVASSFFRWGLLRPWSPVNPEGWVFVGLGNYTATVRDPSFWNAVVNSTVWLVVFPALVVGFSLVVSILVWFVGRGGGLLRAAFILPMSISLAAAGVLWSLVYNPDPKIGVLNAVLDRLGLLGQDWRLGPLELRPGSWLSDPGVLHLGFTDIRLVNLALVVPAFWAFTGFGVITLTAGLTSVPQDQLDAARVDGASAWQVVRYVIVPLLRRPLVVVGVVSVIFALRTFDVVYVMTGGGPAQDTMVLALLLWQQAFAFLDTPQAGRATAIAVLMSAVLVAVSYRYLRQLIARRAG